MITITLRDCPMVTDANQSLSMLLLNQQIAGEHFAVAVNAQFVPRHQYGEVLLKDKDVVDIILPMQGG